MNTRWRLWVAMGLCLYTNSVWGQAAVIDAGNIAQNVIQATNSVRQVAQQAQQLINETTQIYNQVQQIAHLYTQVQQGVQNLQSFDMQSANYILGLAQQIDSKLGQAQQLGYQASAAAGQMQRIYDTSRGVATWEEGNMIRRRWLNIRQEASTVSVQVQAIQGQLQSSSQQVAELTRRMTATQGNRDTLQAMGQQQGMTNQLLLQIQQQQAVADRLRLIEAQERAAQEAARLQWEQQWLPAPQDVPYTGQFRVLHLNGR